MGKPAVSSSVYAVGYEASKAVDGDVSSMMHTAVNQPSAWWWVDLETTVQDATVQVYFRTPCKFYYLKLFLGLFTSQGKFFSHTPV